jgi:hypothetical protein
MLDVRLASRSARIIPTAWRCSGDDRRPSDLGQTAGSTGHRRRSATCPTPASRSCRDEPGPHRARRLRGEPSEDRDGASAASPASASATRAGAVTVRGRAVPLGAGALAVRILSDRRRT